MGFIRFAVENPVKVAVSVILAVLFGFIAYLSTPVRLTPDVLEPEIIDELEDLLEQEKMTIHVPISPHEMAVSGEGSTGG